MNYSLINKMVAKPGKRQAIIDIMLEAGTAFDNVSECLLYLVSGDTKDENVIWVVDVWASETAHGKAMSSDDMKAYVQTAIPLLEDLPIQTPVNISGGKLPSTW